MRQAAHEGFLLSSEDVRRDILVPKYYDPGIQERLAELSSSHDLFAVGSLIAEGHLQLRQGNYIGKMHYGSGSIPYIRTSDIANWEVRRSPKHGISQSVYDEYAVKQDVRALDVLLVHEGTYLIGTPCLVTAHDTHILYQHHLAKLRILPGAPITPYLLIAALLAPIVQRQIRSKQLTADTIDSIVGRLQEVVLPIPRDPDCRASVEKAAASAFEGRADARMRLSILTRGLDEALIGGVAELAESVDGPVPADSSGIVGFLGRRLPAVNFTLPADSVRGDVLIPRYYDPDIEAGLARFDAECDIKTIGELVAAGLLHLQTGDEVGKLAYGGGDIPFIRTSDFANWELKHDPKQRVAREVFEEYSARQDAKYGDILLVRDGTYLVGATTIVGEVDPPFLFSGGIYRIRCLDPAVLSPYLLLALLNTDIVLRQMRAKQFTRDVIDTLGQRVNEVALPIPKNTETCAWIARKVSELVLRRVELRREALTLGTLLEGK